MSDVADPTIEAAQGAPTEAGGVYDPSQATGDFFSHAINQATMQIPEGIAKGTKAGKFVNSFLGGIPEGLINAAGGKKKLLESLERKNVAGDIAGIAGGMLLPLPGAGALKGAKLGAQLLGHAALGAGEMGARSALSGSDNLAGDVAMGAAGGAGGALVGKGVGKAIGGLSEKLSGGKLKNAAERTWIANALPDISNRDLKNWIKPAVGGGKGPGTMMKQGEVLDDLFHSLKDNNLGTKAAQDAFIEATPARWEAVSKAVQDKGLRLTSPDMIQEIESGPALKKYRDFLASHARTNEDETFGAIHAADGSIKNPDAPNGFEPSPARSFHDVRATLDQRAQDAWKASRSDQLAVKGDDYPEQKRLLAQALGEIDDKYFNKATTLVGDPQIVKNMKSDYALAKLMALGLSKGETDVGGMRLIQNSLTALRQNPKGALLTLLAQPLQKGLQMATRPILRGVSGVIAENGLPAITGSGLANIGGKLGRKIEGVSQSDMGKLPATGIPTSDQSIFGSGGGSQQEIQYKPGAGGKEDPNQFNSPKATATALKYSYHPSPMDSAIERGIQKAFQQAYKGTLGGNSALDRQKYEEFSAQVLKNLHSKPGGVLDTQVAARVLFPGNEIVQAQFIQAANQNMQLTKLLHGSFQNGKPLGDGALDTAGIAGGISRTLNPQQAANYDALKEAVVGELGGGAGATFDHIMKSLVYTRDQKEHAIRRLFETGKNAAGWQYYYDALGGRE